MTAGSDDPEDRDPGLARERTFLAWTRTGLSFAAVAGVVLKRGDVIPGLIILCAGLAVWRVGRLPYHRPGQLKLVTATIVAVAMVALIVSFAY